MVENKTIIETKDIFCRQGVLSKGEIWLKTYSRKLTEMKHWYISRLQSSDFLFFIFFVKRGFEGNFSNTQVRINQIRLSLT